MKIRWMEINILIELPRTLIIHQSLAAYSNFASIYHCFRNISSWRNVIFPVFYQVSLRKKWSFPLSISSVNVTSKYDSNFFRFLWIWSHLLKKFLTENLIFCAVTTLDGVYFWMVLLISENWKILIRQTFTCSKSNVFKFKQNDTSCVFIANFEHVSQFFLLFILLTLNKLFAGQYGEILFLDFRIWGEAIQLDVFS